MTPIRWLILVGVVLLCVGADIAAPHEGAAWYLVPGFSALYGAAGAFIITYLSKVIVRALLQRREDYYDVG